jgi:hypothetical protein
MPDREKASLRGPVKTCVTETNYFYSAQPFTSTETTEYTSDGRLLRRSTKSPQAAEWLLVNSYDDQGRLSESVSGSAGTPLPERSHTQYSYGKDGRLATIAGDKSADLSMRYDERGLRVEVQRLPEVPSRPNTAIAGPSFEDSGLGLPYAQGGTFETVYNDRGQALEARVLGNDGQLVARIVRTLDTQGRPISDRLSAEAHSSNVPSELGDQLTSEQKKGLAAFIASHMMTGSVEYKYDPSGRLIERRRNGGFGEEIATISYNDHHDKHLERTATAQPPDAGTEYAIDDSGNMIPVKQSSAAPPTVSEMRYEYVYDSNGNWTEQKVFRTLGNDADSKPESVIKRTITYY